MKLRSWDEMPLDLPTSTPGHCPLSIVGSVSGRCQRSSSRIFVYSSVHTNLQVDPQPLKGAPAADPLAGGWVSSIRLKARHSGVEELERKSWSRRLRQ